MVGRAWWGASSWDGAWPSGRMRLGAVIDRQAAPVRSRLIEAT